MFFILTLIPLSPQPRINVQSPQYTNCIVTLIWADGEPRTPPIMFTSDHGFRDSKVSTDRRKKIRSETDDLMQEYGITRNQIIWLDTHRHYISESTAILRLYQDRVQVPPGCVIFSDEGNAFFESGTALLPELFGARTAQYLPKVHHFLSPIDNHFHGSAKAKWRALQAKNGWGKDDDVRSSLCLLHILSTMPKEEVSGYFRKNFLLDLKYIDPDVCVRILDDADKNFDYQSEFFARCSSAYDDFLRSSDDQQEDICSNPPPQLSSRLDGSYWKKK